MRRTLIFIFSILGTAVVSLLVGYFSGVVVARDAYDACAAEQEECRENLEISNNSVEKCTRGFEESVRTNKGLRDITEHLAGQLGLDLDAAKAELAEADQ